MLTVSDSTVKLGLEKAFSIVDEAVPMFTDMAIKRRKSKDESYRAADLDGMCVPLATTGRITFRCDYRLNGRRETPTIGRYGADGLTLAEARERCIAARKPVAEGLSPAHEMRRVGAFSHRIVGSPTYFAAHGVPKVPEDLAGHACLHHEHPSTGTSLDRLARALAARARRGGSRYGSAGHAGGEHAGTPDLPGRGGLRPRLPTAVRRAHSALTRHAGQAFETEGLIGTEAAPAVLAYLFHRIEDRLDGSPTLIIVDEGWLALDDEDFAGQLREWLKTLRKKNASVISATPSLSDIDGSAIAPTFIESCQTRLLLPNERAIEPQITANCRRFGLDDRQIEIIARAMPKRDYYCRSRRGNRLLEPGLPDVALALCAASSETDQAAVAKIVAERDHAMRFTGGDEVALAGLREVLDDALADPDLCRSLPWREELAFVKAATERLPESENRSPPSRDPPGEENGR